MGLVRVANQIDTVRFNTNLVLQRVDGGGKLREEALRIRVGDASIAAVSALPIRDLRGWMSALELEEMEREIARTILREIESRLRFLDEVGLGYLTLSRQTRTLSGGEAQRINLANSLGASLVDTLYVLEREQRLDASVAYTDAGLRRNVSVAAGGGLVWEARRLLDARAEPTSEYGLTRPTSRLAEIRASLGYSSARTHSFQVGNARGLSAVVAGRRRIHLDLPDADAGVVGIDRSFDEVTGRVRGYVPLWGGGYATHILAVQLAGGAAFGPNAQFGHFGAGGAAGEPELLSGYEVFGGGYVFLPVRGYPTSSRAGRFGWSASAEYRFPIALLNWGLGPWPLFFDRILGSVFLDAGNAWEPNPRETSLAAVGAELTVPLVGFFRSALELRTGIGIPLVDAAQPQLYVRAGLAF